MRKAKNISGWAAVAWAPYSRRSEMYARELGASLHCIHYLLQAFATLRTLYRERPAAVHVQNPPNVCALVVHWYCRSTGARFVIEHHSAAFDPAWRWLEPLTRYVVRRAKVNIVTDRHWAELVESWGGNALVMHDPFLDLPEGRPYPLRPGFNVAFLSTFADDEPVAEVLAAARDMPDINFYVTGDERKRLARGLIDASDNVVFTGFLDSNGEYLGLLRGADAAMVLTTRDHTLQLAGCEALAVGTPLITSDFEYLRQLFPGATVFVPNTAEGIQAGVTEMRASSSSLVDDVPAVREEKRQIWTEQMARLEAQMMGVGSMPGNTSEKTGREQ
jgi:glycosyltransferase involved in cell wall biosynthesis